MCVILKIKVNLWMISCKAMELNILLMEINILVKLYHLNYIIFIKKKKLINFYKI